MTRKEVIIKIERNNGSLLNRALIPIQEAPFFIKLLPMSMLFGAIIAILSGCGPQSQPSGTLTTEIINKQASEIPFQIPTLGPTETPTIIPTLVPVEVAPGEFLQQSQIVGYEARDNNGKLIYVEDIHGNWIKATHEVVVPAATVKDWTNFNTLLGSDFVINTDSTITGVEGLIINKTNGEVVFNFDGKGPESYHIGNIKVQEINGVKKILVAGYVWNGEIKIWEVFNPSFPMESPKDELGWFIKADIANGNWLRWHQRATAATNLENLSTIGIRPDRWEFASEFLGSRRGVKGSIVHYNKLHWISEQVEDINGNKKNIKKEQYPGRSGLSHGFMVDSSCVLISFNALNGDGSITSLPMIIDDILWKKDKNTQEFTRVALASGLKWDNSMKKDTTFRHSNDSEAWLLWPFVKIYPDSTISPTLFGQNDIQVLINDAEGNNRREATIKGNRIIPSASLELWLGGVFFNYHQ